MARPTESKETRMSAKLPSPARRGLFTGAAAVGASAAVGAAILSTRQPAANVTQAPRPAPERGGGYHVSEHVAHYYRTARV